MYRIFVVVFIVTFLFISTAYAFQDPPPTAENITNNIGISDGQLLAFDQTGALHLIWRDDTADRLRDEVVHQFKNADGSWSTPEILSSDLEVLYLETHLFTNPVGNLCMVVLGAAARRDPRTVGLYQRCLIEGTWTPLELIFAGHVRWRNYQFDFDLEGTPHFIHEITPGSIWFGDLEISDPSALNTIPVFGIDPLGTYHVAWVHQGDPYRLQYRTSSDGGITWTDAITLSEDGVSTPDDVVLRMEIDPQGNVHVIWSGNGGLFYRQGTDSIINVAQDTGTTTAVSVGLDIDQSGLVHMTWLWGTTLYYAHQLSDGMWMAPQVIAEGANFTGKGPEVIVDSDGVKYFVWGADDDLFYATLP